MLLWVQLVFMLILIVAAAQLFSNALEYFGKHIGISSGVAGSILAAVSTALPESSVPVMAILAGSPDKSVNQEISVGAILGAPLMLSTLSIFVMAVSVLKKRSFAGHISPEKTGIRRDLNFFLLSFVFAAIAMYVPHSPGFLRAILSLILVLTYAIYMFLTFYASKSLVNSGHGIEPTEPLFFSMAGMKINLTTMSVQLIAGLLLLLAGAKGFINSTVGISKALGISALLLSLIIIPIATELPEKVNSVLWVRKRKDTLACGNITGAMVFQGTLLPALGILMTPWEPNKEVLFGILITFLAALWIRINVREKGIPIISLILNGALYGLYLALVLR